MGKSKKNSAELNNGLDQAIRDVTISNDFSELKESLKSQPEIKNYLDKRGKSAAKDIFKCIIKSLEKAEKKINKCAGKKEENRSKVFDNACLDCKEELEHIWKKIKELKNEDTILANNEIQEKCKELIEKIKDKVNDFRIERNLHKKNTIALVKQLRSLSEALNNKEQEEVWGSFGSFFKSPVVKMFMKKKPSLSGRLLRECHKVYIRYRCTTKKNFIEKMSLFLEQWYNHNASFIPKNLKGTDKDSERRRESRTALGRDVLDEVQKVNTKLKGDGDGKDVAPPAPVDSAAPADSTVKRRKYSVPKTPPPAPPIPADKSVPPAPAAPAAPVAPEAPPPPTPARPAAKPPVAAAPRSAAAKSETPPPPVPRDPVASAAPVAPVAPPAPPPPPPARPAVSTDSAATSGGSITESTLRSVTLTPPKEVADSANPQSGRPTAAAIKIGIGNLRKVTEKQLEADKKAKQRREEEGENPLMRDIRKRPQLKSAAERKLPPKPVVPKGKKGSGSGDLFGILKNAMFARRKAVASDDDKSDDEHDSEWDDI